MKFNEWGDDMEEGEIMIEIRFSDLTGARYEELIENYWGKKE